MTIKIGTIGDGHLDKSRILNIVKDATDTMLNSILDTLYILSKEKCDLIVWLGDVSDNESLDDYTLLQLVSMLTSVDKYLDCEFHIILGNHDIQQEKVHSLTMIEFLSNNLWKNIKVHTKYSSTKIKGYNIEFLPYPEKHAKIKNSICFGHFDRPGAIGDNGTKVRSTNKVKNTDSSIYILGHLHTQQQVGNSYFPGTLYQTSFGESLPKGYGLFNIEGKKPKVVGDWFVEHKPPFHFVNLKINSDKDVEKLPKKIKKDGYYKLHIKRGVNYPSNLMITYPNIVDIIGFKDKKDLEELLSLTQQEQVIAYRMDDNLEEFLEGRGHTKEEIEFGKKAVAKAIKKIWG